MANCDLSRLSIMVVEKSPFIRSILMTILRGLGTGRLHTAHTGREAAEMLRLFSAESTASYCPIDLVLCDRDAAELDGIMLLRWIRRNEHSPNPFMPVIMSGFADRATVLTARDAGVTEFISKPFSLNVLASRLINTIEHPRQFVLTGDYFGPDRRRQNLPYPYSDMRVLQDQDAAIYLAGQTGMKVDGNADSKVRFFRLPNRLKAKLGMQSGQAMQLDSSLLQAASEQLGSLEEDYVDWAKGLLNEMMKQRRIAERDESRASACYAHISQTARELMGQGRLFDYPLLTEVGQSLYQCTRDEVGVRQVMLALIDAHLDSIRAIMTERIKGEGGEVGEALLAGLQAAKRKHAQRAA